MDGPAPWSGYGERDILKRGAVFVGRLHLGRELLVFGLLALELVIVYLFCCYATTFATI